MPLVWVAVAMPRQRRPGEVGAVEVRVGTWSLAGNPWRH
jgi:hypothetical protein